MKLTYDEVISNRNSINLPEVVMSYLSLLFNRNTYCLVGSNHLRKKVFENFYGVKMCGEEYIVVTRNTDVIAVARVDSFKMGYVPDLEVIANSGIVQDDFEVQLGKFNNYLCCVQIRYVNNYVSSRTSTSDYTLDDFMSSVKDSYVESSRLDAGGDDDTE